MLTKRIRKMIGTLQGFRAVRIYRESNLLADGIAALHPLDQWRQLHLHNFTPALLSTVNDEANGKQYTRHNDP